MKRMLMYVAIGAGAMYLLDPDKGAERRAKLLGFYGENKDTLQDYAQTATQAAVTVSQTAASAAGSVVEKAGEIAGKADVASEGKGANGKGSATNVDSVLESRKEGPAKGGSPST